MGKVSCWTGVLLGGLCCAAAVAAAPAGGGLSAKTALYAFDYSYPVAAARIPALKALLDAEASKARAALAAEAKEGKADAKANGFDFNPYDESTNWQVVTELPTFLSLSAGLSSYTGGAHPNHGYRALLWDKKAGKRIVPADLFISKPALSAAIRLPFCDVLDRQRAERRGEKVNRASGDEFDKCIDPVDSTLILGSSDRQHFDRIGVLVGPYEAGPYAEGDYEITLKVTPKVLAAVKPAYRATFALGK